MRRFILPVIATLILATASPAAAVPADWTVTPGGNFVAGGGDLRHEVDSGVLILCESLELPGIATAGTGGNPVAVFPESPGAVFTGCVGPFGLVPAYTQIGDWEMYADSYDPVTDTVTGTIQNVAFSWVWSPCDSIFSGSLNYRYSNSSGQLEILPDFTLTVTYVNPQVDCLGLIVEGETSSFDNTSSVVPPQQIVPS